jgi:hypothetical protein
MHGRPAGTENPVPVGRFHAPPLIETEPAGDVVAESQA